MHGITCKKHLYLATPGASHTPAGSDLFENITGTRYIGGGEFQLCQIEQALAISLFPRIAGSEERSFFIWFCPNFSFRICRQFVSSFTKKLTGPIFFLKVT